MLSWAILPPEALHQGHKKPDIFYTTGLFPLRAGVLKLERISGAPGNLVKMLTSEPHPQSFWCNRPEKRTKNSHFSQVPRWGWCCEFGVSFENCLSWACNQFPFLIGWSPLFLRWQSHKNSRTNQKNVFQVLNMRSSYSCFKQGRF